MHWHTIYAWLDNDGGLWKAVIGFWIVAGFSWLVGVLPWRRSRKVQKQIADRLDTNTPGGLADLVKAIEKLAERDAREDHH